MVTITQGCLLTGQAMHIRPQVATTSFVLALFRLTVKLQWVQASLLFLTIKTPSTISIFLSGRIRKEGIGGCNLGMTTFWVTGHRSCSRI
nr:carboxyl-terminal peptidase, putative (DUF239) [Ipomoea batatas]